MKSAGEILKPYLYKGERGDYKLRYLMLVVLLVRIHLFRWWCRSTPAGYRLMNSHWLSVHRYPAIEMIGSNRLLNASKESFSYLAVALSSRAEALLAIVSIKCAGPLHCDSLRTSGRKALPWLPWVLTVENESTWRSGLLLFLPEAIF